MATLQLRAATNEVFSENALLKNACCCESLLVISLLNCCTDLHACQHPA